MCLDDEVAFGVDDVARQGGAEHGGAQDLRGLLDELVAGLDPGEDPLGQALAGTTVLLADVTQRLLNYSSSKGTLRVVLQNKDVHVISKRFYQSAGKS